MIKKIIRYKLVIGTGFILFLIGLLLIFGFEPNKAEKKFSDAKDLIEDVLMDPNSLIIYSASFDENRIYIEFNGRNEFGGYNSDPLLASYTYTGENIGSFIYQEKGDRLYNLYSRSLEKGTPLRKWVIEERMNPTTVIGIALVIIGLLTVSVTFTPLISSFPFRKSNSNDTVEKELNGNQKIYQDLESLKALFDKNILSEEEYSEKKEKLLRQIE